jgi:simple sugar transport system ATP-binding protein
MVHQHFMLVPVMTVAENLVLGRARSERCSTTRRRRRVRELSRPSARVTPGRSGSGVGAQQRVEILPRAVPRRPVLVLDEPTAVLTARIRTCSRSCA